jgi:hypothetical protein
MRTVKRAGIHEASEGLGGIASHRKAIHDDEKGRNFVRLANVKRMFSGPIRKSPLSPGFALVLQIIVLIMHSFVVLFISGISSYLYYYIASVTNL